MAKRKQWGNLSKAAQKRAARIGERKFDLTRSQVRARYNRGTYNPYARGNPAMRVPVEFRPFASADAADIDWQDAALDNLRKTYEDYYKTNDDTLVYNAFHMSDDLARFTSTASEDDLIAWASIQPDADGEFPDIETWHDLGLPQEFTKDDVVIQVDGANHNIFWYH